LLCSPHNPTGHVPRRAELAGLAALAAEHDVVVVSDEIHADLVYPGAEHLPLAMLDGDGSHTVTLTSASKAFNVAGLRCALAISGSAALADRLHGSASTGETLRDPLGALGIVASLAAWSPAGDAWLAACVHVLERNRDALASWAAGLGIGHRPPEATYLAWLDFAPLGLGPNPSKWLLDNAHVALSPGLDYGEPGSGFARLNFATSPAILDKILGRISAAITAR
jgi:cysteine-S-conjugate beta-lyase